MATKTEIKKLLKEIGYTEAQMDAFWQDNIETNRVVRSLNSVGKTWRDMNTHILRQLPTQKQRDLDSIAKTKQQEEEKKRIELEEKQKKEYYFNHFEEIMLEKIDNGENLTERELSTLSGEYEVDRENGDNRRWSRSVSSYIQLEDRFFCVDWEEGLTESQPDEFYNQPYEVEKKTYEKTITVTEWCEK